MYFGDYLIGQRVQIPWSSNNQQGASVSRTIAGLLMVIRESTNTSSTVGITDTADRLGLAGVHSAAIDLQNSFFQPYDDYTLVLTNATIDGKVVNAVLGEFSIMNRTNTRLMVSGTVDASQFAPTATEFELSDVSIEAANNNLAGRAVYGSIGNALIKQVGIIVSSYVSPQNKGHITMPAGSPMTAAFANASRIVIA